MRTPVCMVIAIGVLTAGSFANAQTKWFKYAGNPVLSPGPPGAWDAAAVFPNKVLFEDSVYRMWYSAYGDALNPWRIGMATSVDGVHWAKHIANPVLREGPRAWDAAASFMCDVVRGNESPEYRGIGYRMWYTGVDASGHYGIGNAISPDGVIWTKADITNPEILPGPWYGRGPLSPGVLVRPLGEKLWFEGDPMLHASFQIGLAFRWPGIEWTVLSEPVLAGGPAEAWDADKVMCPKVLQTDQTLEMFYCGERSDGRTQIGYATSTDGKDWIKSTANPILGRGSLSWDWDREDLYQLSVLCDSNLYRMWYGGTDRFGQYAGWRVGYAVSPRGLIITVSDGDTIVRHDRGPIRFITGTQDTLRVAVQIGDPSGLRFAARMSWGGGFTDPDADTVQLYDDGLHDDSLAGDGVFANRWAYRSEYEAMDTRVGIELHLWLSDSLRFVMASLADITVPVTETVPYLPSVSRLDQNYPNPFNPTTVISFHLPVASDVKLAVYDLLGREVAVLADGKMTPGSHEATFNAAGLASGTYVYRLTAGSLLQSRRMLLLR